MEFLKEILGEELYSSVKAKIDGYNSDSANKENQVSVGNLNSGEYVKKSELDALNATLAAKQTELETANALISDLKKSGSDELQSKVTEYETKLTTLQEQLSQTRLKAAVNAALMSAKAADVDYLTFKLSENGETLELDEKGNIKGWEDKLSSLKTQFPNMFETGEGGMKVLGDNKLPEGDNGNVLTRSEILKKPYAERAALYAENPEAYNEAMKK